MKKERLSKCKLYLILIFACLSGAFNTIFLKLQNNEFSLNIKFKHPWFQTCVNFLCQLIFFILLIIKKFLKKNKLKRKINHVIQTEDKEIIRNAERTKANSNKNIRTHFLFLTEKRLDNDEHVGSFIYNDNKTNKGKNIKSNNINTLKGQNTNNSDVIIMNKKFFLRSDNIIVTDEENNNDPIKRSLVQNSKDFENDSNLSMSVNKSENYNINNNCHNSLDENFEAICFSNKTERPSTEQNFLNYLKIDKNKIPKVYKSTLYSEQLNSDVKLKLKKNKHLKEDKKFSDNIINKKINFIKRIKGENSDFKPRKNQARFPLEKDGTKNCEFSEQKKKKICVFYIFIPAFCGLCSLVTQNFSLIYISASIFQLIGSAVIIFTALISCFLVKKKIYRHHFLAIIIILIGIVLGGISSFIFKNQEPNNSINNYLGIILSVISVIFSALFYVSEEKIINSYKINSFEILAWEGLWGFIVVFVFILISYFNICYINESNKSLIEELCTKNSDNMWRLEDIMFTFEQMKENKTLIGYLVGYILSISINSWLGYEVVKHFNSTTRVIVKNCKSLFIWIFFLVLPTNLQEKFSYIELLGYIILYIGSFIYSEIIVIPVCGLNRYTQKYLLTQKQNPNNTKCISKDINEGNFVIENMGEIKYNLVKNQNNIIHYNYITNVCKNIQEENIINFSLTPQRKQMVDEMQQTNDSDNLCLIVSNRENTFSICKIKTKTISENQMPKIHFQNFNIRGETTCLLEESLDENYHTSRENKTRK